MAEKLKAGVDELPFGLVCDQYTRHKEKHSDYNVLGQALRMECQLTKTDFKDVNSVRQLKAVVKDSSKVLGELFKI